MARREVALREKTLYRMLYETAARADEILGLNIEDLDLAGRRAPVKAKGARAMTRRRGQAREDVVLETVYWDAGTARLLPRRSSPGAAPAPARSSAPATPARTPSWRGCPTAGPAPFLTPTPRSRGRVPGGICTSSATRR
ncbi:hypothetical protein [Saccharopolyspora sp. NPDC050642]|uniref:hypothetical protein n=1 Tax=Saccharopolyspora sp. NPDC050642 TaxID=3157099 RepID=UPI0033DC47FD